MILINLLPHRELARKRRKESFNVALVLSALAGVLLAGVVYLALGEILAAQKITNATLQGEITKLESQIKDIAGLESEIAALRARQQAVENLQSDRNLPVHLLTELTNQLPDGVFLTHMVQADQLVTLSGTAQSNERVSEFLRNLSNNTPWFSKPELIEIVAANIALSPREQKRVANFAIRVKLVRASEAEKMAASTAHGAPDAVDAHVSSTNSAAPKAN